ncbi:MAG TPA: hypothetical protein VES95_07140, partial [Dermatophilaceae bacterium]|nr:hypothetical protein [Dermatophilaceae bacterium]
MSAGRAGAVVASGEMEPWSDRNGPVGPAGGPALSGLLADVLPAVGRGLVLGPHEDEIVLAAARRCGHLTVLLRSSADATALAERVGGAAVTIVAGSLDGFVAGDPDPFGLVVAADGLDRVLGTDSPALSWPQRWDLTCGLATPDAVVVLGLENEFSVGALLDARPAEARHGDEEWRPLHSDPDRPVGAERLRALVARDGSPVRRLWTAYGGAGTSAPRVLAEVGALSAGRPGCPLPEAAAAALHLTDRPLLAAPDEAVALATRAGLLAAVGDGWLVLAGGPDGAGHDAYVDLPSTPGVVRADRRPGPRGGAGSWVLRGETAGSPPERPAGGAPVERHAGPAEQVAGERATVVVDPAALPTEVPDAPSVYTALLAMAEAEDVAAFRDTAARVGAW